MNCKFYNSFNPHPPVLFFYSEFSKWNYKRKRRQQEQGWLCSSYVLCACMKVLLYCFVSLSLPSSRSRPGPATVCHAVRPPGSWRRSAPQAPEQNTLRAPPPEPADPSHAPTPTAAQHTTTGEAQAADPPGQGMEQWRHTLICIHKKK